MGETARELYDAATAMLDRIVTEKWYTPRGVAHFWPANSDGDDIIVWADEDRKKELTRFPMLRQQATKSKDRPAMCLADFVAPVGQADWIGGFAVNAGAEVHDIAEKFACSRCSTRRNRLA
jgi:5-methyltetrahydrofolate--homocysteine methyltransferase